MIPELIQPRILPEHRKYHIVLRYMSIFMNVVDVMAEHRRVFDERGQFCFGKIGRPAGKEVVSIISRQIRAGVDTNIFFVGSRIKSALDEPKRKIFRTRVLAFSRGCKEEFRDFISEYYSKYRLNNEAKLWMLVTEMQPVELQELYQYYIARTGTDLKHGLLYSSSGLFLVARKQQR